jgi:hypothetical protein
MKQPVILIISIYLFYLTSICFAVRRPIYQSAILDTLMLPSDKAKKFNLDEKIGSDLQNFGLGLTVVSLASPLVLYPILEGTKFKGREFSIFALGIFPTVVSVMATGNLIYGKAAAMDTNNTYPISNPIVPYTIYAASILNYAILWKYLSCNDEENKSACTSGLIYGIPFLTEAILVPILRIKFNRASEILKDVILVISPSSTTIGIKRDF